MQRIALLAVALLSAGCASAQSQTENADPATTVRAANGVRLTVVEPPIPAAEAGLQYLFDVPGKGKPVGPVTQQWSMLGREDRGAATRDSEYRARSCKPLVRKGANWLGEIVARAADRRVVIVNESHTVTRHRDTIGQIIAALRPLGYSVYAAETFGNYGEPTNIETNAELAWPHLTDGTYTNEAAFGRLIRKAKTLGYRLAAYEQKREQRAEPGAGLEADIKARETAQAENLAEILATMAPDEKLIVHVGYAHASEVPLPPGGRLWMAARLQRLTGIDPLTISQTLCSSDGGKPFLAELPDSEPKSLVDLVLSQPVASFKRSRPAWRRASGDLEVDIPEVFRAEGVPLVIEAFRTEEPFAAVPMDRIYVEPGEDIPLLLPPGDYKVRAVVPSFVAR
ncbi:hypothetical protein [Qipengyuania spongiae]|uniref:Uncharacterized protein n=1 Tax=Qipengyuania spongiae TaxID=2909673 RepID=A0ABY5T637_9SPHN|nr:hypothetical protein [Qipengyuania spongiae]UVI40414.1 hypothetical protein L1F33_05585 [Qipengyuania spongiae]